MPIRSKLMLTSKEHPRWPPPEALAQELHKSKEERSALIGVLAQETGVDVPAIRDGRRLDLTSHPYQLGDVAVSVFLLQQVVMLRGDLDELRREVAALKPKTRKVA